MVLLGDESGYHITVDREFGGEGFGITIWRGNHGTAGLGVIRDESKAVTIATYLYENLAPEYEANQLHQRESMDKYMAEQAKKPKPKPLKVLKNTPKIEVLVCPDCDALMLPDDVSDERVYECGECGTSGAGEDARRCEQCNKFTAKVSDTSCAECNAAMDDAEKAQAQRSTTGVLVLVK